MKRTSDFEQLLINKGLRLTEKRKAILQLLATNLKPLDVVAIENQLFKKKLRIDQVTIYRILDAFVEKQLVNRLNFHEGKFRYELVQTDHHHIICETCGLVEEVYSCPLQRLEEEIKEKQNFTISRHALEFFGLCKKCQQV